MFGVGIRADRIWRYDKKKDSILLLSVKDTAVIGNYYTVTTKDGPDDGLERVFAKVEGAAAPIIERLCLEGGPRFQLDDIDRFTLSMYLGLLHGRVPSSRMAMTQVAEFTKAVEIDMRLAQPEAFLREARDAGSSDTNEEIEQQRRNMLDGLRAGDYRVRFEESVSLDVPIITMREVSPYIASMGWWLVKRASWPFYPIGDAPVTVWPARHHPPFLGVGFATPDAEVAVPLNPETVLVMGHNVPDGYVIDEEAVPPREVAAWPWPYQYRQWRKADRFVFAQSRADLEALRDAIDADERQLSGGGLGTVSGGPPEWKAYLPTRGTSAA
jgi:hypothetical protein